MADVKVVNQEWEPIPVDITAGDSLTATVVPATDYSYTIGGQKTFTVSIWHDLNINDISKGIQTNDIKITLDGEEVTVNATDLDIRNLAASTDTVKTRKPVLSGQGSNDGDYTITLTANTEQSIPSSVPNYDYVLVLSNRSDTEMVWGKKSGIANGTSIIKGVILQQKTPVAISLLANESIYVACSASKNLDYTVMKIEEAS